jgi:hypothetical protein
MPDPYIVLKLEEVQPGLMQMQLVYEVVEPDNTDEMRIDTDWTKYRHAESNYGEECEYVNKSC